MQSILVCNGEEVICISRSVRFQFRIGMPWLTEERTAWVVIIKMFGAGKARSTDNTKIKEEQKT